MTKNDYREHLDKIACSIRFRKKMEELLSDTPEEGYADSVRYVEAAPKINCTRWTAIAVSALLAFGVGGFTLYMLKDTPVNYESTDLTESTEAPDSTEPASVPDVNDIVNALIDEALPSENESIKYVTGSGQFNKSVWYNDVYVEEIRNAVKSLNWERSEQTFPKGGFYIVRNLCINAKGELYTNGEMYTASESQDLSALEAAFDGIRNSDSLSQIKTRLIRNYEEFHTMECDMAFYYRYKEQLVDENGLKDDLADIRIYGGNGRLYYDQIEGEMYYKLIQNEQTDVEYYRKNRYWALDESGNFDTKAGFRGMGESSGDYCDVIDELLWMLELATEKPDLFIEFDAQIEEEVASCYIRINKSEFENVDETANFTVDKNGSVIYADISYVDRETGEGVQLYMCFLGDRNGGGIIYDDHEFVIPAPSAELKKVFDDNYDT